MSIRVVVLILSFLFAGVASAAPDLDKIRASIPNIDTAGLKAEMAANENLYLIDVRTVRETNIMGGSIKAKRNIIMPRGWLEFRIEDAVKDKNAPIVVYCGTERRSPLAVQTLIKMGYTNVRNYTGGYQDWVKAGLPITTRDKAPNNFLYSMPVQVSDRVWSAIGETAPSTYENGGHNNNLSFIIGDDAVMVFNGGGSYLLAQSLHIEIKKITDKPVKYLVYENGQGHASLGGSYWKKVGGVEIIAHKDAAEEIRNRKAQILDSAQRRLRDKFFATEMVEPDVTFEDKKVIDLGGIKVELLNLGPAHSPGDIMAWMPATKLVISGDIAFHERMLPVFENSQSGEWIKSWDKFEALGAKVVIPGHGGPTTMPVVRKYTRDYLVYMRGEIGKIIENGGELGDAYKVDQSAYEHLDTFEELALRNAARIFQAMEFE